MYDYMRCVPYVNTVCKEIYQTKKQPLIRNRKKVLAVTGATIELKAEEAS